MRYGYVLLSVLLMMTRCSRQDQANTLTAIEKSQGWQLLFDGESTNGWRGVNRQDVPAHWQVRDGALVVNPPDIETTDKGDIITIEQYSDFELKWEWKMIVPGSNSGVKYFVNEAWSNSGHGGVGLEYQLLDDADHEWMQSGEMQPNDYHTLASAYEIYPASNKKVNPLGQWNSSRIKVDGQLVEHWLNGVCVLSYDCGSEDFDLRVAQSKFHKYENFGHIGKGHILLQEHGSTVSFRNIKIKK